MTRGSMTTILAASTLVNGRKLALRPRAPPGHLRPLAVSWLPSQLACMMRGGRGACGAWDWRGNPWQGGQARSIVQPTSKGSIPMTDPVSELAERGKALLPEERSRLVDILLESLNEPTTSEVEAAWDAEIERRLAEYDSGAVQSIDSADVFEKARSIAR